MQLLKALWALAGAALCCFLVLVIHAQFLKEGNCPPRAWLPARSAATAAALGPAGLALLRGPGGRHGPCRSAHIGGPRWRAAGFWRGDLGGSRASGAPARSLAAVPSPAPHGSLAAAPGRSPRAFGRWHPRSILAGLTRGPGGGSPGRGLRARIPLSTPPSGRVQDPRALGAGT